MWLIFLNAVSLLLNSDLAIVQFFAFDYSPFLTFLVVFAWTNLSIVITFSLTDFLDKKLVEKKKWRAKFAKIKWVHRTQKAIKNGRKKILVWLLRQERIIIFLILLIPGVPMVKSVAIIAARILKLKNALILMLIANSIRVLVVVCFIYSI